MEKRVQRRNINYFPRKTEEIHNVRLRASVQKPCDAKKVASSHFSNFAGEGHVVIGDKQGRHGPTQWHGPLLELWKALEKSRKLNFSPDIVHLEGKMLFCGYYTWKLEKFLNTHF